MKTNRSAALVIKRRHQSAPKEHWADREISKAAEEISQGRYIPDTAGEGVMANLGLALSAGTARGVATGDAPTLEEMQFTRDMNTLGTHPRVIEAMEKMKREIEENPNSHEAVEKAAMLQEMNERQAAGQMWDGQERWEGKENEAMRQGQVLSPQQFFERLARVIGIDRVLLSHHAVKTSPEDKSGRVGLYIKNPEYRGEPLLGEYPQVKARELRDRGLTKLNEAKKLRAAGLNAMADKAFQLAGDMAKAATEILMEASAEQQTRPTQFLRVGTLQWPLGTEWMMMNFDEYGVPTTAKYLGWRTALLTMVRCRSITEEEAHKAFPVGSGPVASWYLEQLFMLRNPGSTVQ